MITKSKICDDYNKLMRLAKKAMLNQDYEYVCQLLEMSCRVMYNYNIKFVDHEAEDILSEISSEITFELSEQEDNTIMFYDYFALENRGLSYIYLNALLELEYKVIYVVAYQRKGNMPKLEKLIRDKRGTIVYIDKSTKIQGTLKLLDIIKQYKVSRLIAQTVPWDISLLMASNIIENKIKRFLINITDHAYWLGTKSFDYYIEFRAYGGNVSKKYREIRHDKILLLPYYPVKTSSKFRGFPFSTKGKRIIFTGGSLYKIDGSPVFLNIVKHILDRYEDTVFLYVGNGDTTNIEKFILKNNYYDRAYVMKERDDLDEIMKRCYFYLSTYPLVGGLMSQYAVNNSKYPITLRLDEDYCNCVDSFFINKNNNMLSFTKYEDLIAEIDQVLEDPLYLKKRENDWENTIITEECFATELNGILREHKSRFEIEDININLDEFYKKYVEGVTNNKFHYSLLYVQNPYLKLLIHFPIQILNCVLGGCGFVYKSCIIKIKSLFKGR